jgi:hypothetical protein
MLLAPMTQSHAKGLDIFLNNDTASVEYLTNMGGADVGMGFLFNTTGDWVAHGSMLIFGREYSRSNKIEGGLGGKAFLANVGGTSVVALGLGGQMTFFPKSSKFGFGGYGYYAPQIVTSGANNFFEYGIRAEYQMMETASVYLGLHHTKVELSASSSRQIDDGLHFGVNIRF